MEQKQAIPWRLCPLPPTAKTAVRLADYNETFVVVTAQSPLSSPESLESLPFPRVCLLGDVGGAGGLGGEADSVRLSCWVWASG